jgi:hypothetical protein
MPMQHKYNIGIFVALISIFGYACSDLIEESIEEKVVVIITPSDGTVTENYTQTFWWEKVDGALNYRLQMVYNKFDSAAEFKLDTLLSKTRFVITLKPAKYQWRVVALNGSSETSVNTIQDLRIDSASIAGQNILLTSPINNFITKEADIIFKWQALSGATEYRLKVTTENNYVVVDSVVSSVTSLSYEFEKDSTYYWTVTGKHNDVMSSPSSKWSFVVDRVAPDSVTLNLPLSGAMSSSPTTLKWTAPNDAWLSHYEIFIYKGSVGTPFSNKYNPYSTATDTSPLKTSFTFNEGNLNDKIIWKVRVVDKAGNKSSAEKTRSFTIN